MDEIDTIISSCSMHNAKSKNLKKLAQILVEKYNGEVPKDVDELVNLPGVDEKTANVLVSMAYGIPAVGVDTHVARVAKRLGITKSDKPDEIEKNIEDWRSNMNLLNLML